MLIINETYAINNDGICYTIYKRPAFNPKKPDAKREYAPRWHLNTLPQAVNFLIDRGVVLDGGFAAAVKGIERFKRDIANAVGRCWVAF